MSEWLWHLFAGLPGFLVAVVFHEAAHAYMAKLHGDDTAEREGRLTLNPLPHLDIIGTVIFPMIGAFTGTVLFGWARPVPVNPVRFKNVRNGIFWVSFAGPGANIIIGVLAAICYGLWINLVSEDFYLFQGLRLILYNGVFINLVLAFFNLLPLPPLDGSKMVSAFLPYHLLRKYEDFGRYSFVVIFALLLSGILSKLLLPAVIAGHILLNFFGHLFMG